MIPASLRLTKKDFETLRTRVIYKGDIFDVAKKEEASFKIACVIPKKRVAKATSRNAIRRKVLHAVAQHIKNKQPQGFFVIYPKNEIQQASYQKIEEEISKVFATLYSI